MNSKTTEIACGAIITNAENQALLVFQQNGFWGFPKGHVEPGETELETAVREVKEETNLDITPDASKRLQIEYDIAGTNIHKIVVLFLARLENPENSDNPQTLKRQESEIATLQWTPFDQVEQTLTFPEWKQAWRDAQKLLS